MTDDSAAHALQRVRHASWEPLCRFATDGRYAIDNNEGELCVRPSVIGRKNDMLFGSDCGGEAAAIWYTIVNNARFNQVRVLPYLYDVLDRTQAVEGPGGIASSQILGHDVGDAYQVAALEQLPPDRWLQAHPEHRTEERQRELENAEASRRQRRARRRDAVEA